MSAQTITIQLPEEEIAMLDILAEREGRTRNELIRSALQPLFLKAMVPESIELSKADFQSFIDAISEPPSEEVLSRRSHLMSYERWQ